MAKDMFGETSGAARRMLWAITVRAILATACTLPLAGVFVGPGRTGKLALYSLIAAVVWIDASAVAAVILIVRKHIAGKIIAWVIVAELVLDMVVAILQAVKTDAQPCTTVIGSIVFGGFILFGLLSNDLKYYYPAARPIRGFPVELSKPTTPGITLPGDFSVDGEDKSRR